MGDVGKRSLLHPGGDDEGQRDGGDSEFCFCRKAWHVREWRFQSVEESEVGDEPQDTGQAIAELHGGGPVCGDQGQEGSQHGDKQLVEESLGKKKKGILPIISVMPKDNHSVMQLYLDGFKNNFFTFFYSHENNSSKINNETVLLEQKFLKNKDINQIMFAQKKATENVFKQKNIPFRSFEIKKRDEKTLGELFCFFILETILIGKAIKINPFDQPAVELIKKETKKILI